MDRGPWWAFVYRVAKSQTQLKQLSMHACTTLDNSLEKTLMLGKIESKRGIGHTG